MVQKISTVVFDLGGVLIDWNPDYLYKKLIPDQSEREAFLSQICTDAWHQRHDAGVSFEDNAKTLLQQYANIPHIQVLIKAWGERFAEMLGGPIQGTVDLLKDLHQQNIPLYALTNWPREAFTPARNRFKFLSLFKDIIVSGEERMKKPDPLIYERLLERTGIDAKSSIYIDDRAENLVPASALGFKTIKFTTPEALAAELHSHNLLPLPRCA